MSNRKLIIIYCLYAITVLISFIYFYISGFSTGWIVVNVFMYFSWLLYKILRKRVSVHASQKRWWSYWYPRRITLKQNPPVYRFLFWVW